MDKDISVQNGCQGIKSVREYVALYHAKGWNVIALEPYEKKPAWSTWKEEQEKKQDDSILELKYWDSVNVGVICGKISNNLFVVDCDTEKSALWFIQNFKEYLGTYQVKTKRGIHYYFQIKGDIEKVESFKIKMEDEDIQIDVQGDGKYVVSPPSVVMYYEEGNHEYQPVGTLDDVIVLDVDEYKNFIKRLKELSAKKILKKMMGGDENTEQENIYEIDLDKLKEVVTEHYKEGVRHHLVLYVSGFLRKNGVSEENCTKFWESIWEQVGDEEQKSRLNDIRTTYTNDINKVAGYSKLVELVPEESIQQCIKSQREIPYPFFVQDQLLYEEKAKSTEPICDYFYVDSAVVNVKDNTNMGYILKFPNKKNKEVLVSIDDLGRNKFAKLFSKHVSVVDDSTAQKVLKYITRYTLINQRFIRIKKAVDSIGWINGDYYLPQTKPDHYFVNLASGYGSKGDKEKEIELFRELISQKSYLALGYVIAISGILLPILGLDNYIIYAGGRTGAGKSTMSFLALSIFGNYELLKATNNNAVVGYELFLKQRNHTLAVLDEVNTATGDVEKIARNLIQSIYQFASKLGRLRAQPEIILREQVRFEGLLYVSSEDDLKTFLQLERRTVKGVLRRTILIDFEELYRKWGGEENLQSWTELVYATIKENYGNMLQDIVEKIKSDIDKIKEDFKNYTGYYRDIDQGWMFEGQERCFALFATATKFLERNTKLDFGFMYELIDRVAEQNNIVFNQSVRMSKADLLNEINAWLAENYGFFKVTQTSMIDNDVVVETTQKQPNRTLFGKVEENKLLLTAVGFSSLAKHLQTSEVELKRLLVEFGLAEKDDERIMKRTCKLVDGIKLMMYVINYSME